MAYDGTVLKSVIEELNSNLTGARVEKIYQPSKEEIVLNLRNYTGKYKLLLSATSNNPRVYLTNQTFENPKSPPTFCMLLRKHLENSRVLSFEQYKMDRILKINFLSKNELGDDLQKSLIVEIMGKHSNIILIESDTKKIYDSIKRVNSFISRVREILPGLIYDESLISTKENPLCFETLDKSFKSFEINKSIKNNLVNTFTGISPLIARETAYRANLDEDRAISSLDEDSLGKLYDAFKSIVSSLNANEFKPTAIIDNENIIDFSSIDLMMYPNSEKKFFSSISELLDEFYIKREKSQNLNEKSSSIKKVVKNHLDRAKNKLSKQSQELEDAFDRDKYKIYADLISSNYYKIDKGIDNISLENFYNEMEPLNIPLDEKLSAQENANKYYKKYSKLKTAVNKLNIEIENNKNTIKYLNSVLLNIELSETSADLEEIREELVEMGYIKKNYKQKKNKVQKIKSLEYNSTDSFKIYAGKNNRQNEELTLKFANKNDMWFHVKDAPGSHVILKEDGREFTEKSIEEAATIAAYNSSLKNSDNIIVDYTLKKNVKRHPSKIPGLVSYVNYNSIIISSKNLSDYENYEKNTSKTL
ncbi:Predicted component of the ribosome quality control (RQC) complex, YloA/Tae2 family, contains fibronectin-binding (FbpA) and DUF814 domains [Anaerosphaera aminiphila DSM 21120]|uniref:Rqc2 homolog RqcH n=1 Tax=Anaerosphaera aminiphila DSM 21120 TaxID=1120995 RepID=A0A1M5NR79_9FIRM|nr:NFACT RNA binding domain-containing protein [Anaerosphaera aminiphila]SHG92104.1 Predicted component of the ribosome quality control (RQC) complex, YloA/Tae2 family, contains fibronectin-binding (FbpA) and DUF814 domains [Anaerosphaera aminiphila DSM 21120]